MKEQGHKNVDEQLIFETYEKMQAVEEHSAHNTKSARRAQQRRRMNKQIGQPETADRYFETDIESADVFIDANAHEESMIILPFDVMEEI